MNKDNFYLSQDSILYVCLCYFVDLYKSKFKYFEDCFSETLLI